MSDHDARFDLIAARLKAMPYPKSLKAAQLWFNQLGVDLATFVVEQVPVPTPTPAPVPAPQPTGAYRVQGADITAGATAFVGVGLNLGTPACFDQPWGNAKGHAADAKAAGHTIVRLGFIFHGKIGWDRIAAIGFDAAVAEAITIIDEYRKLGIVVMVASFYSGQDQPTEDRFWTALATRYKADSGVWFNENEPVWNDYGQWHDRADHLYSLIRSAGNPSIVVVDVMLAGNDMGWPEAPKRVYDSSVGPALVLNKTNVVFSNHNYAGNDAAYYDAVRAAGLAMVVGEFGFTLDPSQTTAGTNDLAGWTMNRNGTLSVLANFKAKRLCIMAWHGNHNDGYSLKATIAPFWSTGPDSELGQRFKAAIGA